MRTQFETTTVRLADLFANTKRYQVPRYQRTYAWTEEQWEVLWEDLLFVHRGSETFHYMGPLLFQEGKDAQQLDTFWIIDGQQRLTTLVLLALAAIHQFHVWAEQHHNRGDEEEADRNQERARIFRRRFIGEKEPTALYYRSRLELNRTDNPFFQDLLNDRYVRRSPVLARLPESHRRLWACYCFFRRRIAEQFQEVPSSSQALAEFLERDISQGLLFTRILVADDANAYLLFETLNARGIELAPNDLIKNYIFAVLARESVPEQDIDHLIARWDQMIESLGAREFIHCLRAYVNSHTSPVVRGERLFRHVKTHITDRDVAQTFIEDLDTKAALYMALRHPADEFWNTWPDVHRLRFFLSLLRLFSVRQHVPLVFALYDAIHSGRCDQRELIALLRDIVIIAFRYNVVGKRNPNIMEKVYNGVATEVRQGRLRRRSQIWNRLRELYLPDNEFEQSFANIALSTSRLKRLVKYVLLSLEAYRQAPQQFRFDRPDLLAMLDDSRITVEHVLPQAVTEAWAAAFPAHEQGAWVYRLGNLTLLEDTLNREAGSRPFKEKREIYRRSRFLLAQDVARREEWTAETVLRRQQELARDAVRVWRLDP